MDRRNLLKGAGLAALLVPTAALGRDAHAMTMDAGAKTDGTPMQFMPKGAKDPNPAENDLAKYPKCPYCGMDRTKWSHTRHLIHYSDDLADGTCSLHCAAISLSLNLDRNPKAIYVGDAGAAGEVKPLTNADTATYVIDPGKMGTMTARSKHAYADKAKAEAAKGEKGELANFDEAMTAAYLDMAKDTVMIRKRRAERRAKMMQK